MAVMSILRLATLSLSILLSVILLGLSAHLHSLETQWADRPEAFPALIIVASVFTILNSATMIAIDLTRKGAIPLMIIYELVTLPILSVLFLAGGASSADRLEVNWDDTDCSMIRVIYSDYPKLARDAETACHEYKAIQAFAFLTWILLLGYTIVLLVLSCIAASRGRPVWFTSVRDAQFFPQKQGPIISPPGQMVGSPQYVMASPHQTPVNMSPPGSPPFNPQQLYGQQPMMAASPAPGQNAIQPQYSGQYHGQFQGSHPATPQV